MLKVDVVNKQSDVIEQCKVPGLPYFKVYNSKGKLLAEGQAAFDYLMRLKKKAPTSETK